MQIDVFSSTGSKAKTMDLPASLFESEVNWGLMHQAVVLQQANARQSAAHVKTRGEVQGSTKKLFSQKHTGQARRGPIRAAGLRGGGKVFGPRNTQNPTKDMPKKMRHAALRSALSLQATKKAIHGLENFPESIKTKSVSDLLKKMPVEYGRKILLVTPGAHNALYLSARNIAGVKTIAASYLNIEDVLNARHIVFVTDAIEQADKLFGKKERAAKTSKYAKDTSEKVLKSAPRAPKGAKKAAAAKKAPSKKKSSK